MRGCALLVIAMGCRTFHDGSVRFDECQPYRLACDTCTFDNDADDDLALDRIWRCVDADDRVFDAVRRRALDVTAWDTHFYAAEDGLRIAAVREWDEPVSVCGRDLRLEWYGEILDCVDDCEHEPQLDGADPDLATCGPVL